jgi:hypothetical protein
MIRKEIAKIAEIENQEIADIGEAKTFETRRKRGSGGNSEDQGIGRANVGEERALVANPAACIEIKKKQHEDDEENRRRS